MSGAGQGRLAAYLERIGLAGPPPAGLAGLEALQRAHRLAIPFENLDVRLGREIRIDSDSVFDKLVARRRGGYCFEHNRLLADMIAELGIEVRPLLARVWLGLPPGPRPPRTHTLLLVTLGGELSIADAGFGGSYVPLLPLRHEAEETAPDGASHRLRQLDSGDWLLERAGPAGAPEGAAGAWQAQYSFDLARVDPGDLEQANHWTATRPGTRFTTVHIVSRALPDGFASLAERTLRITRGDAIEELTVADPNHYREVLREWFGLPLTENEAARLPLFAAPRERPRSAII